MATDHHNNNYYYYYYHNYHNCLQPTIYYLPPTIATITTIYRHY